MAQVTRVLLVEDNPLDVELLREAVFDSGAAISLDVADTLAAAVSRLRDASFDAILLDLTLPDSSGLVTLECLLAEAPAAPVLVLTGMHSEDIALAAVRAGAQDYLLKDEITGSMLVRALRYAQERKHVLDALRTSEEWFRALAENLGEIITVTDADGSVLYMSPSGHRLLAYAMSEGVPRVGREVVHPDDAARVAEAHAEVRAAPNARVTIEYRVQGRDGDWRWLEKRCHNLLHHPSVRGIVGNARDVTSKRLAQDALEHATNELRAIVDISPLPIVAVDENLRVRVWNRAAERVFGWSAAEIVGQPYPLRPEAGKEGEVNALFRVGFREGLANAAEVRRHRRDGTLLDLQVWSAPLPPTLDGSHALVAMFADVTEQRRLEDNYRQAQKMEAVGRLAGGIAHDFNNVLTAIRGHVSLILEESSPSESLRADLLEVEAGVKRASELTSQLLAFSRKQVLHLQPLDINDVVRGVERMLRRVIGETHALELELDECGGMVLADRGRLEQVIVNLAVNARDAMPDGGAIRVSTTRSDTLPPDATIPPTGPGTDHRATLRDDGAPAEPSGWVTISVVDTGTGMDRDTQARIFEPFFTTKDQGKGTGLGLSTVYGIVRQSGGDVTVRSAPGAGTIFNVYLPLTDVVAPEPAAAAPPAAAAGQETILLVEDEKEVRRVVRRMLESRGYSVLETGSPAEAHERSDTFDGHIHLLLTDVVMPGGGGRALAQELSRKRPDMRVLFMSGYDDTAVALHGVLEQGAGFISKPFSPVELGARVREILGHPANEVDAARVVRG